MINIKLLQITFMAWILSRILFFYIDRLFDSSNGKISVIILFTVSFVTYVIAKAGFLVVCTYQLFIKTGHYQLPISWFLLVIILSMLIPKKR